jgi:hypothetical protein
MALKKHKEMKHIGKKSLRTGGGDGSSKQEESAGR